VAPLQSHRSRQHVGVHVRIPVLVTTDQEPSRISGRSWSGTDGTPSATLAQLEEDIGDGIREDAFQVEEHVAHLVENPRPHAADLVGVPEDLHVDGEPASNELGLSGWQRGAQMSKLLANSVLAVEDTPADGFGRMGGKHGPDLEPIENRCDLLGRTLAATQRATSASSSSLPASALPGPGARAQPD